MTQQGSTTPRRPAGARPLVAALILTSGLVACAIFGGGLLSADEVLSTGGAPAVPLLAPGVDEHGELELLIRLRGVAAPSKLHQIGESYRAEIAGLQAELLDIHRSLRPSRPLSPAEERRHQAEIRATGRWLLPADVLRTQQLVQRREHLEADLVTAEQRFVAAAVGGEMQAAADWIESLGGEILGRAARWSTLAVRLPAARLAKVSHDSRIIDVRPLIEPVLVLDHHVQSLGIVTGPWQAGFTAGSLGLIDTGVQVDHPALRHVTFSSREGDLDIDLSGHGTAMAGILVSNDPLFRGLAFGASQLQLGSVQTSRILSDLAWIWASVISLSAISPMHSEIDEFGSFRTIVAPVAGNNILGVLEVDDFNTVDRSDDRVVTPLTNLTVRRRTLSAPGTNTRTTNNLWFGTRPDFVDVSGRSAAVAHVSGLAALLRNSGVSRPIPLLLNTADAWSANGPLVGSHYNEYGWGYLDGGEAWLDAGGVLYGFFAKEPFPETVKSYRGFMFAGEKATLTSPRRVVCWQIDSCEFEVFETFLDLDLEVYRWDDGTLLASSSGASHTVEQVSVEEDGEVVLVVHRRSDFDPQTVVGHDFQLAAEEGFAEVNLLNYPVLRPVNPVVSSLPDQQVSFAVDIEGDPLSPTFESVVEFRSISGGLVPVGPPIVKLGTLAAGSLTTVRWNLMSPGSRGVEQIRLTTAGHGFLHPTIAHDWDFEINLQNLSPGEKPVVGQCVSRNCAAAGSGRIAGR